MGCLTCNDLAASNCRNEATAINKVKKRRRLKVWPATWPSKDNYGALSDYLRSYPFTVLHRGNLLSEKLVKMTYLCLFEFRSCSRSIRSAIVSLKSKTLQDWKVVFFAQSRCPRFSLEEDVSWLCVLSAGACLTNNSKTLRYTTVWTAKSPILYKYFSRCLRSRTPRGGLRFSLKRDSSSRFTRHISLRNSVRTICP